MPRHVLNRLTKSLSHLTMFEALETEIIRISVLRGMFWTEGDIEMYTVKGWYQVLPVATHGHLIRARPCSREIPVCVTTHVYINLKHKHHPPFVKCRQYSAAVLW